MAIKEHERGSLRRRKSQDLLSLPEQVGQADVKAQVRFQVSEISRVEFIVRRRWKDWYGRRLHHYKMTGLIGLLRKNVYCNGL